MPKPRRETQVRSPSITAASTLLMLALTLLAFAGQFFGCVPEPSPTPQVAVVAPAEPSPTLIVPAVPTPTVP